MLKISKYIIPKVVLQLNSDEARLQAEIDKPYSESFDLDWLNKTQCITHLLRQKSFFRRFTDQQL